ncbi:MAG: hypothetical protein ACYC3P_06860 [Bellilinea sp.]
MPATWLPDPYQDWTFTSKQTMAFQDTPRFVRRTYVREDALAEKGISANPEKKELKGLT